MIEVLLSVRHLLTEQQQEVPGGLSALALMSEGLWDIQVNGLAQTKEPTESTVSDLNKKCFPHSWNILTCIFLMENMLKWSVFSAILTSYSPPEAHLMSF